MGGTNVYNFLYMVSSVGRTNSNPAWQEIEVDDLMEVDEVLDHHLREEVDLMEVDEVADSSISKRFLNVT